MTAPANELTAAAAAAALRDGSLSSEGLVQACLARVAARDDAVGAWTFLDPDLVLKQARAADRAAERGQWLGPLHGIPVGLKDIIDTADMPTEHGSKLFAGRRPATDSAIAALLRQSGAVIMGKTVTTEYALTGAGKTKNPHDPTRTPGGSSSGSAAGVADFQVPLAIGTQTGGSMIRPASFCGVHGYKPTFGSISRAGLFPLARPLDTPGVYGRSLDDLALCADALMQPAGGDFDLRAEPFADLAGALAKPRLTAPPRIAFVKGPMWKAAEPYMDALFADFTAKLGNACREVEMTGIFERALECHSTVMMPNLIASIGDYIKNSPDLVMDETKRRVAEAAGILAQDYVAAYEFKDSLAAAVQRMFEHADILITAGAPGEAPVGLAGTGNAIFQKLWTLVGVPTLTLPLLQGPNGMPIGVQVIGRHGGDADLFQAARWLEENV
ncbi:MAG: amidase [Proteobacteria bacterium]|nr:amidase [Pseudomonadota bacterium]